MNRKVLAAISGVLLVICSVMGLQSMADYPEAEPFSQEELQVPGQFLSSGLEPMPEIAGDWITNPGISILVSMGSIYKDYGGSVRVEVQNNGTHDMFLEEVAFTWTGSFGRSSVLVHRYIDGGGSHEIKALDIPGPTTAGGHNYQISMKLLLYRNNGWFRPTVGGDEWLDFSQHTIDVVELSEDNDYETEFNYRDYYEKVNSLVDLQSENVEAAAENATSGLGQGYHLGKVCAIFDYLDENCVYTDDPGGDVWYSPDEFLDSLKGDCEDYAMLIAAMVDDAGGTSRIYLTKDHAFAGVYIGNTTTHLEDARGQVRAYYGTPVKVHAMEDDTGYWMVVDPLGSFYAGGLAVGQSPVEEYQGRWNTTFEETDLVHAVDVTGIDLTLPLLQQPNFWMGMMLVFGFITVMSLLVTPEIKPTKKLCHICGQEIGQDLYVCPECKTTYHRSCAFQQAYCMTCRKPIRFPPPPEIHPPPPNKPN